jgi:membrane-bound serine protease (ClpP class)
MMVALLAITGLVLIYLEFFFPGAILGIGGGLMLGASLVYYFFEAPHFTAFIIFALICLSAVVLTIYSALWKIRRSKLSLSTDQMGYQASGYPKEMIGEMAVTTSDLKPSGYVEIISGALQTQLHRSRHPRPDHWRPGQPPDRNRGESTCFPSKLTLLI